MLAVGRDTLNDSRLFASAGVFLKGLTVFSHTEYQTVGLYTLYKASLIYILPVGLYDFFNGRQVEKRKPYLNCFSGSPVDTNGIHTTNLEDSDVYITS